jgi:hypothetical protein
MKEANAARGHGLVVLDRFSLSPPRSDLAMQSLKSMSAQAQDRTAAVTLAYSFSLQCLAQRRYSRNCPPLTGRAWRISRQLLTPPYSQNPRVRPVLLVIPSSPAFAPPCLHHPPHIHSSPVPSLPYLTLCELQCFWLFTSFLTSVPMKSPSLINNSLFSVTWLYWILLNKF